MQKEAGVRFYISNRMRMFENEFNTMMNLSVATAAQDMSDMIKDDLKTNYKHYIKEDQMIFEDSVKYDFKVIVMNEKEYRGLLAAKEELGELKELLKKGEL